MNKFLLIVAALAASLTAHAALTVTNGAFGTANTNATTVSGGGWFESDTTTAWIEGTWSSAFTPGPGGDTLLLLMDGSSTTSLGYIYQNLGVITAGEIALGGLRITADFAEKQDGATNDAVFSFYKGPFTGATGTDIATAGLTSLGSFTLNAAAQGSSYAADGNARHNNTFVGTLDLSALSAGDQVWMRIGESRLTSFTGGDLMIDNVTVTAVPEPGTYGLIGAGALLAAVSFRKRRQRKA